MNFQDRFPTLYRHRWELTALALALLALFLYEPFYLIH